jgi:very-short-patch-repair endonuclease
MPTKLPRARSEGQALLAVHLRADKIGFTTEFKFHPVRKWRFDFLLAKGIAVEVDGGVWIHGRHNRGQGMEDDNIKNNEALLLGYRILYFSTGQVKSGDAIAVIRRALSWASP